MDIRVRRMVCCFHEDLFLLDITTVNLIFGCGVQVFCVFLVGEGGSTLSTQISTIHLIVFVHYVRDLF